MSRPSQVTVRDAGRVPSTSSAATVSSGHGAPFPNEPCPPSAVVIR